MKKYIITTIAIGIILISTCILFPNVMTYLIVISAAICLTCVGVAVLLIIALNHTILENEKTNWVLCFNWKW